MRELTSDELGHVYGAGGKGKFPGKGLGWKGKAPGQRKRKGKHSRGKGSRGKGSRGKHSKH